MPFAVHKLSDEIRARRAVEEVASGSKPIETMVLAFFRTPKPRQEKADAILHTLRSLQMVLADDDELAERLAEIEAAVSGGEPVRTSRLAGFMGALHAVRAESREFVLREEPYGANLVPSKDAGPQVASVTQFLQHEAGQYESVNERRQIIWQFVYERPGYYIKALHQAMTKAGLVSVTYGQFHSDIDALVSDGRIMTIGGAQGRLRFCFPHYSLIFDRSQFLNKAVGFEGSMKAISTEEEPITAHGRFMSVVLLNSHMKPALGLVPIAAWDQIQANYEMGTIEGFGTLRETSLNIRRNLPSQLQAPDHTIDIIKVNERRTAGIADLWTDHRRLAMLASSAPA